ncbi:uncharacterized protein TA13440 [Theileria annulata]|uniref:Leo1-like protein n=1 Tax=Theileria annulata TaxID=5874 RepID=Q4UEI9_THEAN|nr:uncharacterized protein TA13440 [Theileria annulata]CAI74500.1 hypothetical protein TA13440 [Theileria annulata]|eukprot:XP_952232.1 hypothetical protein TA13440 [Theileria annulata]
MDENIDDNDFNKSDNDNTDDLNKNTGEPGNSSDSPFNINDSNNTDEDLNNYNVENDQTNDDRDPQTDNLPNDDDIVGLFEDSDENVDDSIKTEGMSQSPTRREVEPVEQEQSPVYETEIISATLPLLPRPGRNENLVVCKFPPTLMVCDVNDIRNYLRSNPHILENPPNPNNLSILLYDIKTKSNNSFPKEGQSSNQNVRSNSKIVAWDDNTVTLFVGTVPLDVEFQSEVSFLFEDSNFDLKPVHAEVDTRLQTRFSNLLKNKMIKQKHTKRQKMEVTFLSDAIQSQYKIQEVILFFINF